MSIFEDSHVQDPENREAVKKIVDGNSRTTSDKSIYEGIDPVSIWKVGNSKISFNSIYSHVFYNNKKI